MSSAEATGLLSRSVSALGRWGLALAGIGYLLMTAIILFDIVARRMLGFSTAATAELTGYLLAIGMTLGLAGTLEARAHVRIDVLVQKLPLGWRVGLHLTALAALLITAGFMAYGAVMLTWESWELHATDLSGLRTPLVIPQGIWTLGFLLFVLMGVALLCRSLRWLWRGSLPEVDRALLSRSDEDEARETVEAAGLEGVRGPYEGGPGR